MFGFFFLFSCLCCELICKEQNEKVQKCVILCDSGDRLGDHLISYIKAKWIAYKNDLPLFLTPNKYFDSFKLSEKETFITKLPFSRTIKILETNIDLSKDITNESTNYLVPWNNILRPPESYSLLSDSNFRKEIQELLKPKKPLDNHNLIYPPKNKISVALHVRTGGGYDKPKLGKDYYEIGKTNTIISTFPKEFYSKYSGVGFPLKILPEKFYADSLRFLSNHLNNPELYVHIFTDDPEPEKIVKRISDYLNLPNLSIHSRKGELGHTINVLEDFYSLQNFDYLIRSGVSHFSIVAEYIFDFKGVVYSDKQHWEFDKKQNQYCKIIDTIGVKEKGTLVTYKL